MLWGNVMKDRRARAKVLALIVIARVNVRASLSPGRWPRRYAIRRYQWLAQECAAGRRDYVALRRELADLLPVVLGPIRERKARSA